MIAARPFCNNDHYWQVYFHTNKAIVIDMSVACHVRHTLIGRAQELLTAVDVQVIARVERDGGPVEPVGVIGWLWVPNRYRCRS